MWLVGSVSVRISGLGLMVSKLLVLAPFGYCWWWLSGHVGAAMHE